MIRPPPEDVAIGNLPPFKDDFLNRQGFKMDYTRAAIIWIEPKKSNKMNESMFVMYNEGSLPDVELSKRLIMAKLRD